MQYVKITSAGKDQRLTLGYTYQCETLASGLLRLTSVGGKFSCLVNPDTTDVDFDVVDAPADLPLKGWRNSFAVELWSEVYLDGLAEGMSPDAAGTWADSAVQQFKSRWEGTTFLHTVEDAA